MVLLSRLLIILVGLNAATAFAGKRVCGDAVGLPIAFEPNKALAADEVAVLNALLWHENHEIKWDERLDHIAAELLRRGRWSQPLSDVEFDQLKDGARTDALALIELLRRARTVFVVGEPIGAETVLMGGQMLAIERAVIEALVAQGGVKMKWDRRLEGVARYVVDQGKARARDRAGKRVTLIGRDFDYLTRALRNGPSDPVMIDALMRVLRGPNI